MTAGHTLLGSGTAKRTEIDGTSTRRLLYDAEQHLSVGFELLKDIPKSSVTPVFDPKLASAVAAAIGPPRISIGDNNYDLDSDIRVNNPPIDLAYDVYVRYGGREFPMTKFAWESGDGDCDFSLSCHVHVPVGRKVDIILRPGYVAASDVSKKYNYWNQEITFHDVPVTRE